MTKTIKLKNPTIEEWIYAENNKVAQRQEGYLKQDVQKFHISELSEDEAKEYAEEYKKQFLEKYNSLKSK